MGRRSAGAGAERKQADPAQHRVQRLPLVPRHGPRVVRRPADAYANRPADVLETAAQVRDFLNRPSVPLAAGELTPALLDEAAERLARDFDPIHGGFGGAPKFPQPMLIEFLLRTHVRTGDAG